jgi:tetratricopeptide (TPR) repeat protein
MDILESIVSLVQKNLLGIITILWTLWFAGVSLAVIVCTVSCVRNRQIVARMKRKYEQDKWRREEDGVQIELDLDRINTTLISREAELREDAERMGLDFGLRGVLENFRGRIQQKLADLPATHHEIADRLKSIYEALDDFKDLVGPDQISLARMALRRGSTGKAATLLKRAQSLGNQQSAMASGSQLAGARNKRLAASATFLLGQLAETDCNYFMATHYYQLAADLQPANLTYLNTAAEFSYSFEELQETGHLLEQVIKIQEKLLGPEHPDLAQTLNNLGVLRHTQGRHAEAEAYYLWAMEICEANQFPRHQDAVNLMQNYAVFLQDLGRLPEADAIKSRAAIA